MPENKKTNIASQTSDNTITFEVVNAMENIVKAISYQNGKKQEVLFYAIPEDEFEALIPQAETSKDLLKVSAG